MSSSSGSTACQVRGIDISRYQPKVDWGALTASGIEFCFIKASEGAHDVDASFQQHWDGAGTAGLVRGAYHFFRPQIPVSIQADLFAKTIGPLQPGDLGPALDLEGTAGWVDIPPASRVSLALNMLGALETRFHATPIVYMSPWFATEMLKSHAGLARFPIWIAEYTQAQVPAIPKPWSSWTFWQHSQSGNVPGIAGAVDLDRFQGSLDDLKKLALGGGGPGNVSGASSVT